MKIYTKTGDSGTTSLIGGERVKKHDPRVEAYGTVDELSAHTAMLRDMLIRDNISNFDEELVSILTTLMDVEALLATGKGGKEKIKDINNETITNIEQQIEAISAKLTPLTHFTIPGGNILISQSHVCRTVCRRAERMICHMADQHPVSFNTLKYINRLSDYFYVLGRSLTQQLNVKETIWQP